MKKKAFTLTELLVVVVIIGVLSAVVLPKFNKVIESRRTAEAESVMRAVRNEQEMRCTLDQNYTTNKEKLAVWPKRDSANYTYALNAGGMSATRKDKDYTLEIKTYLDGGICCRGSYCSSLNKDYPLCDDYEATPNTKDCVSEIVGEEGDTGFEPPELPDCNIPAQTTETQRCGCANAGIRTRTFDEGACEWSEWSSCTVAEECPKQCDLNAKPATERDCGCDYKQQRSVKCDESTNYEWEIQTGSHTDNEGWQTCAKPSNNSRKREECPDLQLGSDGNGNWIKAYMWYQWSDESCAWEPQDDTCCQKHEDYTEPCGTDKQSTCTYTWNYQECHYTQKNTPKGSGVWSEPERVEQHQTFGGYCVGTVTSNQYYAGMSNTVNTDVKYEEIEASLASVIPKCPAGTYRGGKVPAEFKGSMCYTGFRKQGESCDMGGTLVSPPCINGRFNGGNTVGGPYSDMFGLCSSVQMGSSGDCTDSPYPVCVIPYGYYLYRVQN